MTTDPLKALFALLETDDDDFASLVQRFGIDPATDLQNCDLTNVDFGSFTADTLDLTGSNLAGANLSKIKCKTIIGAEDAIDDRLARYAKAVGYPQALIDGTILAVSRYQNSDWVTNQILANNAETGAPILAFYDSFTEQDILTKRMCSVFNDVSHPTPLPSGPPPKFIWFYSKADKGRFEMNAASLERNFFDLLRWDKTSDDIGVYPYLTNRTVVAKIRHSLQGCGNSIDKMREVFARQLNAEVQGESGAVILFSGYPPISRRLYEDITSRRRRRLKMIFLCSSSLEKFYDENGSQRWRRLVVPAYSVGPPLSTTDDLMRLRKRIDTASGRMVSISPDFLARMERLVDEPLGVLKSAIIDRLRMIGDNRAALGLNDAHRPIVL